MPEIRIQPTSDILVPGKTVRIPVLVVLDQPLKVRGVHATFHGAEETKATYTSYNAATKSMQSHTATEYTDIIKNDYLLSGEERKGFFGNVADGLATIVGSGDHKVLQPGQYPFDVEVLIPSDARPSFVGEKCRVFYELSVFIDIPLWRDTKARQSFHLKAPPDEQVTSLGPVRTRYPEDQDRGLFDSLLTPDIRVEAALAEGSLREGDTIEGIFVVETPKPLRYRAISARLIAMESTTAHEHTDSYAHLGEPVQIATDGEIEGHSSQEFKLPVISPGATTSRGHLFSVDCFVQIELDVPWAKDPRIRVPITLR